VYKQQFNRKRCIKLNLIKRKIVKYSTAGVEEMSSNEVMAQVVHTHRLTFFYIFHEPQHSFINDTNKANRKAQRYTAQSDIAFSCI
jgi:hypothetical protein